MVATKKEWFFDKIPIDWSILPVLVLAFVILTIIRATSNIPVARIDITPELIRAFIPYFMIKLMEATEILVVILLTMPILAVALKQVVKEVIGAFPS